MDIFILFLFNFFINSLFVFATTWALVEFFLFIFRIKNFRFKYFVRILPIIKVFLDLGIYNFSSWSTVQNINPLLCEKGTRTLTVSLSFFYKSLTFFNIFFHLPNNLTFSLSDILTCLIGKKLTYFIVVLIIIGSVLALAKFFAALTRSKILHKKLLKDFKLKKLKIFNNLTISKTFLKKIIFGVVPLQISPGVIRYQKKWFIVFPKNYDKFLTTNEINSILEHEKQHIVNYDYYFSVLFSFLQAILWYNPLILIWRKKISLTRELACDQAIKNNPHHLTAALKKFAKKPILAHPLINSFFKNHSILIRIKNLAYKKDQKHHKSIQCLQGGILILASIFLMFSKIWIF